MNEQQAMLQAIYDNLEDDTVRLAYADWLDEHGDSDRAELIRLQYELQKTPEYRYLRIEHGLADGVSYQCKKAYAYRVREEQLIKSHPEWITHGLGLGLMNAGVYWRTGFIEKIEVSTLYQIFYLNGDLIQTPWATSLVASIPTLTRLIPLDQVPNLEEGGYEWYDLDDRLLTMITKQTFTTPEQAVDALGREIVLQIRRFLK